MVINQSQDQNADLLWDFNLTAQKMVKNTGKIF